MMAGSLARVPFGGKVTIAMKVALAIRCLFTGWACAYALIGVAAESAPSWPKDAWTHATPESMGMDSVALSKLVDFGSAIRMDGLVVVRHGRIVAEAYYAPFKAGTRHRINSATKGIVGALVGAAIQAGYLKSTEQRVAEFFPEMPASDARKNEISVQHLLDMTSGIDWDEPLSASPGSGRSAIEMEHSRNWIEYVLSRPMAQQAGRGFNYDSGNSHLLSAILSRTVGVRAEKFAATALFGPMGITDFDWNVDPAGNSTGGWGLSMTPLDMAKIGYLYLRRGTWEGRPLLPLGWADRMRSARSPMSLGTPDDFYYGDGWWAVPKRGIYAMTGFNRQLILIKPASDLVVVTVGRAPWRFEFFFDLLESSIRSDASLKPNTDAIKVLRDKERAAAGS